MPREAGRAAIVVAFAVAAIGCSSPDAARSPKPGPTTSEEAPEPDENPESRDAGSEPFQCGSETCTDGELCEERRKGHALDDQGRPLDRKKCMPLPDPCREKPTCSCVEKHVHLTHCRDEGGRVYIDDYPG